MTAFSVAVIISGELPVSVIEGLYIRIPLSLSLSEESYRSLECRSAPEQINLTVLMHH